MNKQPQITDATRRHIEKAFSELYKTKPAEKITVNEICAAAGVHRSTFYRYFTDVYAVLSSIEERLLGEIGTEMREKLQENPGITPLEIPSVFSEIIEKRIELLYCLNGKHGDVSFADRLIATVKPIILPVANIVASVTDVDYIVTVAFTVMLTTLRYRYEHNDFAPSTAMNALKNIINQEP